MHYEKHTITRMQGTFLSFTRCVHYMINQKILLVSKMNYAKES